MAKSLRSKSKVAARRKKRTDSHYAVADAERMARVHANLTGKSKTQKTEREAKEDAGAESEDAVEGGMAVDGEAEAEPALPKKISTSGARDTRREQWRESKGMPIRPKSRGLNHQGGAAAKRKAGRPSRRR